MTDKLSKTGLSSETIAKIQQVFKNHKEIIHVCIYGSRVKGDYHNGSDIDLSILEESLKNTQLLKIENELDDLLLPFKIDLNLFRLIENKDLISHIKRLGIDFYCRQQN